MASEVDFNAPPEPLEEGVNFYATPSQEPVHPALAAQRAMKAHFALGANSPGFDILQASMSTEEGERIFRDQLSAEDKMDKEHLRNQMLREVASSRGSKITQEQASFMKNFAQFQPTSNPDTILERKFADAYTSLAITNNPNGVYRPAATQVPANKVEDALDLHADTIATLQIINRAREQLEEDKKKSSWGTSISDFVESIVPLLSQSRLHFSQHEGLLDTNLKNRIDYVWSLPLDERAAVIRADILALQEKSFIDAERYAAALTGINRVESIERVLQTILDVEGVATPAVLAARGLTKLLSGSIRGISKEPISIDKVYAELGDIDKAAEAKAIKKITAENKAKTLIVNRDPLIQSSELIDDLPLSMKPGAIFDFYEYKNLDREASQRLTVALKLGAETDAELAFNLSRIDRLPQETVTLMMDRAKSLFPTEFPRTSDSVIQMDLIPAADISSNVNFLRVSIGKRDGTLFKTEREANKYAKEYGLEIERFTTKKVVGKPILDPISGQPTVVQQGDGWLIQVTKPLDETDPLARYNLSIPTDNQNPVTLGNMFLKGLRGAAEGLAPFQMANREMATSVPRVARKMLEERIALIGKLKGQSYKDLIKVLNRDRDFTNYEDGIHGRTIRSQSKLDQEWKEVNGRFPTERESLAYYTYHQVMELDLAIRNLGLHRDLSRQGIEHYSFKVPVQNSPDGESTFSPFFLGKFVKEPDWSHNFGVWVQDGNVGKYLHTSERADGLANKATIAKYLEDGYQMVQIPDYTKHPLKGVIGDGRLINYVLTRELKSKPLPMRLVDKKDGIHVIYPHDAKVVQAQIFRGDLGKPQFVGDNTVILNYILRDAEEFAKNMNHLQALFNRQAPDAAIDAFIETRLPYDVKYWRREFSSEGRYSLEIPFIAVKFNQSSLDAKPEVLKSLFKDSNGIPQSIEDHTKSPLNLMRQVDNTFLQERDMPAMQGRIIKSGDSPTYKIERADTIDPMAALQKGIVNAVKSLHMTDAKLSAIEQWVSQYANLFADPAKARNNPLYAFHHADGMLRSDVDLKELSSAKVTRARIKQFIGTQDEFHKEMNWAEEKLFNSAFVRGVESKIFRKEEGATGRWMAVHDFPLIKNPLDLMQHVMTHSYFGMFNPAQYYRQAQGMVHVTAIAGKHGLPSLAATMIQRAGLQFNDSPEILAHYANVASKMGYGKPEHFIESYNFLKRHGGDIIAGDHALAPEKFGHKILQSKGKQILNWGLGFFKEGERQSQIMAFHAAYRKWRSENPTSNIDRSAEYKILRDANTMWNNMSRAGNSAIEENAWAAIPLRYTTWTRRLIDQMWGKELDWKTKLRVMAVHSMWYGGAMGVGVAFPWPVYDELRKTALANAKDMTDPFMRALFDGIQGTAASLILGRDYDITRRVGPSNFALIHDALFSDKEFWEIIGGPVGSYTNNLTKSTYPLFAAIKSFTSGDPTLRYTPSVQDFIEPLKSITSINAGVKAYFMYNLNLYMSRNEKVLSMNANLQDAAMTFFFGTTRQEWTDAQLAINYTKTVKEAQRQVQNKAIVEIQRAYRALGNDNDWDKYNKHLQNADYLMNVWGDFRDDMKADTYARAAKIDSGTLEKAMQRFRMENLEASKIPANIKKYLDLP